MIDELISGQFAGEDIEEEINEELEALLANELPEVPDDKLPELEKPERKKGLFIVVNLVVRCLIFIQNSL